MSETAKKFTQDIIKMCVKGEKLYIQKYKRKSNDSQWVGAPYVDIWKPEGFSQ